MPKSLHGKLTFANVMSVIAVFIALGGTSYAISKLPKNSIGSKQLKKNAVATAKLKNEAVTAGKVKKGTLTGTQINASTLGTVPTAISAQNVGGKSADQIEQSSKLRCPGGTKLVVGSCFETSPRPAAKFEDALETCARAGRSLPGMGELAAFLVTQPPPEVSEAEFWAGVEYHNEVGFFGVNVEGDTNHPVSVGFSAVSGGQPFYCATPARN